MTVFHPQRGKYEPFAPRSERAPTGRKLIPNYRHPRARHIPLPGQPPTRFMDQRTAGASNVELRRRKYPTLLIEETARLFLILKEQGVKGPVNAACRLTGVGRHKLKAYLLYKGIIKRGGSKIPCKYTKEQLRRCYELAVELIRTKGLSKTRAFDEAGKKIGICGETVRCYVRDGMFVPGRD